MTRMTDMTRESEIVFICGNIYMNIHHFRVRCVISVISLQTMKFGDVLPILGK